MDGEPTDGADTPATTMFETLARTTGEPLEVGDLDVTPEGDVVYTRSAGRPVSFSFAYAGVAYEATLPADRDAPLSLAAQLGHLPYSAETPTGRRMTLALLRRAHPARGRIWLASDGRIHLNLSAQAPRPHTPINVMATVVALLLDARPYVELLRASRVLPAR